MTADELQVELKRVVGATTFHRHRSRWIALANGALPTGLTSAKVRHTVRPYPRTSAPPLNASSGSGNGRNRREILSDGLIAIAAVVPALAAPSGARPQTVKELELRDVADSPRIEAPAPHSR